MGRRSTKTTKTGKFMNPTDQWRKQCRKKELKKNKVQRTVVREAVLKSKNPQQILAEIEEIEKMEIEAGTEELPNDKGLKEKKRKLHETLSRIVNYYERDDYNSAQEVKKLIVESEKRRRDMTKVYNSYRTARSQYSVSDIPLPEGPEDIDDMSHKHTDEQSSIPPGLVPPGPPPGPPPDIVFPKAIVARPPRAVRFVEDDDENSEEEEDNESDEQKESGEEEEEEEEEEDENEDLDEDNDQSTETQSRPEQTILQPPGPPPGPPPSGMQQYTRPPAPLFPPAPLGRYVPPPSFAQPRPLLAQSSPHIQSSAVISTHPLKNQTQSDKQSVTISAQPQIRNVQAEVTKFLPTSLRIRRDQPKAVKSKVRGPVVNVQSSTKPVSNTVTTGIRGDAYEAFMKEMQGLL